MTTNSSGSRAVSTFVFERPNSPPKNPPLGAAVGVAVGAGAAPPPKRFPRPRNPPPLGAAVVTTGGAAAAPPPNRLPRPRKPPLLGLAVVAGAAAPPNRLPRPRKPPLGAGVVVGGVPAKKLLIILVRLVGKLDKKPDTLYMSSALMRLIEPPFGIGRGRLPKFRNLMAELVKNVWPKSTRGHRYLT